MSKKIRLLLTLHQGYLASTLSLEKELSCALKSVNHVETFRMYRQYRDDVLEKDFQEFQKKRLVNRRRGNHTLGPKKNRALPFVPMSFQLSQGYYSFGKGGLDDEDFDDEDDDSLGNKRKIEVKARQASHTNYLLMRGYCAPGIVSLRNLNPNDNVVVNSCQVRLKLRNTPVSGRLPCSDSFSDFISDMPSLPPLFNELVNPKDQNLSTFTNECSRGYTPEDVDSVLEIFSIIEAGSFLGMKVSDLGEKCIRYEDVENGRTKSLQQYMQDLLTYRQVLQVGGTCARLVAISHADPWVLHSYSLKEHDKALLGKNSDCSELAQQASEDQAESDISVPEPSRKKPPLEIVDSENSNDAEKTVGPVGPRVSDGDIFSPKTETGIRIVALLEGHGGLWTAALKTSVQRNAGGCVIPNNDQAWDYTAHPDTALQ